LLVLHAAQSQPAGPREARFYGTTALEQINQGPGGSGRRRWGVHSAAFQSNHEGEKLVDRIQQGPLVKSAGILIKCRRLTPTTSIALP